MTVEEQLKKEQDKRLEELSDKLSEQEKDIAELKEKLSRKAAREERKAAKKESRSDLPGQVLKFFLTVLCSVIITLLAIRLTDVENGKSGKGKDTQTVLPVGQQLHEPTGNKQEPTRVDISVEENAFNIYSCLEPFDVVLENAENYIGSSRLSFKIRVIPNVDHLRFNGWTQGEIFILTDKLVPNARRDDFEQNDAYRELVQILSDTIGSDIPKKIREASTTRNDPSAR